MKFLFSVCMLAAVAVAQTGGMAPLPKAADYPAHAAAKAATIAADLVRPEQVKKIFNADLNHAGYLVVEIAIYPEEGRDPEFAPADFMLRAIPETSTMRPSEPSVVAASVIPYDKHQSPSAPLPGNVRVYSEATIGYESGGPYRRGGVYTGGGVVVTNAPAGPPPPPATAKDQARTDLQISLGDKALPAGRCTKPTAGYLYFPKPAAKGKIDHYELTYYGSDAPTRLLLKPSR